MLASCAGAMLMLISGCSPADSQALKDKQHQVYTGYDKEINALIADMTLEEKVKMIHANASFTSGGVARLNIPELTMSDGPHGVRPEHGHDWIMDNAGNDSATYLPTSIALGATWNPELGYSFGEVLGSEAKYRGKDIILGPGVNIIRTPLNGRNFEYLSEDPYLTATMAVGYIKGVQDQGVAACIKHFVANNQEIERSQINVEMSERALREIYLPAYKAAVLEGKVLSVMGAYNKFRGQFATHNEYLINEILKGEWGFEGLVMSDWGAVHNTMEALLFGTDLEMGTDLSQMPHVDYSKFFMGDTVIALVRSGKVPEAVIDDKVRRILRVMYYTDMFGERTPGELSTAKHQQIAQQVAEEAIVLLKNEGNILPIDKKTVKTIAVVGANATRKHAMGGGSSQVRPPYEVTPLEGLKKIAGEEIHIIYAQGFEVDREEKADPKLIEEAVNAAQKADIVIYVGGWVHGYSDDWSGNAYDAESVDKPNLTLPFEQDKLIDAVLKANTNTIMVMMGGGPVDMTGWAEAAKGILQAWYPGMEGGTALARIVFGEVNPSGKLPMTFPMKLADSPAHALGEYPGNSDTSKVYYNEDVFVGYRFNDTFKVAPRFCFGYGLSYTTFDFSDLKIVNEGDNNINVSIDVSNKGDRDGAEVVQLYVRDLESSVKRPLKELKAFQKVFLEAGATKTVSLSLNKEAFQFFDEDQNQWVLEPGDFELLIGNSSRDIYLKGNIRL